MIYFAEMKAKSETFIKIGKSDSPKKRIQSLQVSSPYPIRLLGVRPGNESDEEQLHNQFEDCRVRGEWFKPHPELLSMIKITSTPGSHEN